MSEIVRSAAKWGRRAAGAIGGLCVGIVAIATLNIVQRPHRGHIQRCSSCLLHYHREDCCRISDETGATVYCYRCCPRCNAAATIQTDVSE